jgi:hypothetical protein
MFTRKALLGLMLASISVAALDQQSHDVRKDIFGRPYVNQSAEHVYYQANPFAPLPQFWNRDVGGVAAPGSGANQSAS